MIDNYLEDIILSLNENPYIEGFEIIKKKITGTDGYIRLKAKLTNNNLLEISLYCQKRGTSVEVVDYRYHWQDEHGVMKMRWDNCPHHKEIDAFPFHVHLNDQTINPSKKVDIYQVLKIIEKNLQKR